MLLCVIKIKNQTFILLFVMFMKKWLIWIGSLLWTWVVGISAWILFNVSYYIFCSLIWIAYVLFAFIISSWIPKWFWLYQERWIMDADISGLTKWGKFVMLFLLIICLLVGWKLYNLSWVSLSAQEAANWVATHITLEAWKLPNIDIY